MKEFARFSGRIWNFTSLSNEAYKSQGYLTSGHRIPQPIDTYREEDDMSDHNALHAAEAAMGAVQELGRRAGRDLGHPHGVMGKGGQMLVQGAAAVAPAAVAAVAAGTSAAVGAVTAVAVAAAPVAIVVGAGYGVYRFVKWLNE